MTTLATILLILACLILIVAVLLQPAKGGTGGVLGGSSQSLFGSTGGTTFLFRLTMWCAAIIGSIALFLNWHRIREGRQSVIDTVPAVNMPSTTAPANPTTPETTTPAPETKTDATTTTGETSP